MPVRVTLGDGGYEWIYPTEDWQAIDNALASTADFAVDPNFYVEAERAGR
jgi:hypothetical protein